MPSIQPSYHAHTAPALLTRLRQMLGSSARADIAVGYFFMSGFLRGGGRPGATEQDPLP